MNEARTSLIISISSDIGTALAMHMKNEGWRVGGTFRTESAAVLTMMAEGMKLEPCDLLDIDSINQACHELKRWASVWDVLIVSPGSLDPIGDFERVDFDEWERSFRINFLAQLRIVRNILPWRRVEQDVVPTVLFFAGGGTNSAPMKFSAYTVAKLALVKMCELLDAEIPDVKFVIVGPGWVRTKIHDATLAAGERSGPARKQTMDRLSANQFVSMDQVIACCDWAIKAPRESLGGRNVSAEHDEWGARALEVALASDPHMYKLRRRGNEWKSHE